MICHFMLQKLQMNENVFFYFGDEWSNLTEELTFRIRI